MKKIFTYEEAMAILPRVIEVTDDAVRRIEALAEEIPGDIPPARVAEYETIVEDWAEAVATLGVEVKGLWLVDFDSGAGYYCWRHPEPSLQFFHGYDEGFGGRVKLN